MVYVLRDKWAIEAQEYEQEGREVISQIDSSLKYVKRLFPSSVIVCRVEKAGSIYILKMAKKGRHWGIEHLRREREALKIASEISGITHLIQDYEDLENYANPILKEFYKGTDLLRLGKKIRNTPIQRKLETTVHDLHRAGIADLDLHPRNIVLSPHKKDARIIEIGDCKFRREEEYSKFDQWVKKDLSTLENFILE